MVCGSDKFVQAHHLLPKERFAKLQFEPMNGLSLCARHHKFGKFSFHLNPLWAAVWLKYNRFTQWEWAVNTLDTHPEKP